MWERRTFHDCASELIAVSEDFRSAYTNRYGWDEEKKGRVLSDSSVRGREVLQILSLSVRGEQDIGLIGKSSTSVGSLYTDVTEVEQADAVANYSGLYGDLNGCKPLALREALNKIAHHDPTRSGFFANENTHDLILVGTDQKGLGWLAIVSLIDFARLIQSLPDIKIGQATTH